MSQAYTFPTVTIQGVVYTAKKWGQFPTVTYKSGGTAGSEVVTIDSSLNVTVQISSGVSTNTQIVAAVNAATQGDGRGPGDFVTASTSAGATTPTCTVLVPLAGGVTAAVKASAAIGALVYTAVTAGTAGNSITVQYIDTVALTIGTVVDGTHLTITSNANMVVGATVKQGANSTTITTVTDATHIIVASTTGFTAAAATSSVVAGGEKVKVTSTAILIQIANFAPSTAASSPSTVFQKAGVDYTTPQQVIAAVAGTGAAAALVVATMNPAINSSGVRTVLAASAVSLAGGLAAAPATVTTSLIVITSKTNDATQNGATLTLTPGATAGAEVVTMTGNNISVQIQSGTSTVTQITTALTAAGGFAALYTASGTSANTLQAPYQVALTGALGPTNLYGWYADGTSNALTTSFVYFPFGGSAEDFSVFNDETTGTKQVIGSWDGINNHFIVPAGTTSGPNTFTLATCRRPGVYLKQANGAPAYRAFAVNR